MIHWILLFAYSGIEFWFGKTRKTVANSFWEGVFRAGLWLYNRRKKNVVLKEDSSRQPGQH